MLSLMRSSAIVLIAGLSWAAQAQTRADAPGRTITIVSSSGPGGGYDIYARLFAAHVGRHLPGNPAVVVRNMPGAGGMVGANFLYNVAPRDGSTFGVVPQTVAISH